MATGFSLTPTLSLKGEGGTAAIVVLLGISLSIPAFAQDKNTVCRLLTPAAKSAAYVPGVDVHGNPVVGADVNAPAAIAPPDKIRIPVTISVLQGLQLPPGTKLDADAGMVEVYMNGKVMYNGQDITPQTYAACGMQAPAEAVQPPQAVTPPQQQKPDVPPPAVTLNQRAPLKDYQPPKEGDVIYGEGH